MLMHKNLFSKIIITAIYLYIYREVIGLTLWPSMYIEMTVVNCDGEITKFCLIVFSCKIN